MDLEGTVRQARAGDEAALTELCTHYHPILCRFFCGLLRSSQGAEDLAQDTLLTMLRALPGYKQLPGSRFDGWIFKLGYSRFIDLKRKKTELPLIDGYDPPDPGGGAEQLIIQSERAAALWRALARLDEESRHMVTMRYELDMHYKDIAQALGTRPARVKWRLNDALKKLKRTLQEEGFEWTN